MNDLIQYTFEQETVRVVLIDDEPWFVATDLCRALAISNTTHALKRLDDDERGLVLNDTLGGAQQLNVVSESGMYSLILGSRKAAAKRFKRWVTGEVLPAIRKTGRYILHDEPPALPPPAIDDAAMRQWGVGLALIREARQIWGRKEAQALWIKVGLPSPIVDGPTYVDSFASMVRAAVAEVDSVTSRDVAVTMGIDPSRATLHRIGATLRMLGWVNRRERVEGELEYVWRRLASSSEAIDA